MGGDKKRKRDTQNDTESFQRPSKTQVTGDKKKSGEHRQLKSERKKKKQPKPARQNTPSSKISATTEDVPQQKSVQDDLATGQDFVSLSTDLSVEKQNDDQKSHKASKANVRHKSKSSAKGGPAVTAGADARFICFVGNLPYTATTEQIASHFSKLQPKSIRLSTDKKTGKPKGFAFLEFDDYDRMKTCLKLYHHSIFDPEHAAETKPNDESDQTPKTKGRKINVELTAGGGGGKSAGRRDRIKAKNQKLNDERARDWEKKKQEETEKSRGFRRGRDRDQLSGPNAEPTGVPVADTRGAIHPSRMSRVRA